MARAVLESPMASCCRAEPCEEMFGSESTAREDMEAYLRKGLGALETEMVDALPQEFLFDGSRVLEIGGGVGAIQAELLRRGASTGEVIELVESYAPYASRLAEQLRLTGRSSFRVHDVLADPEEVEPADVVVMNRVVCCSADGLSLARFAAGLTRGALLMSFPRSNAVTKAFAATQRFAYRLLGRKYRAFVWPEDELVAAGEREGLAPVAADGNWLWKYVVLVRQ